MPPTPRSRPHRKNRQPRKNIDFSGFFWIFRVFDLFLIFKGVLEVREAFQWIRSAILTHPDLSRPPDHFSGPISANFRTIFNIFLDFNFSKSNFFRKSPSHVAVLANPLDMRFSQQGVENIVFYNVYRKFSGKSTFPFQAI